jgi:hypothetical protein
MCFLRDFFVCWKVSEVASEAALVFTSKAEGGQAARHTP